MQKSVSFGGKRSSITITIKRMESVFETDNDDQNSALPRSKTEQPEAIGLLDDPFYLENANSML